jgi:hypothetical protein
MEVKNLGGKSWTAYIWLSLLTLIILLPVTKASWSSSLMLGLIVTALVFAFIAYQVLLTRSYSIYYDEIGIWVYSGILPWSKGVSGVKWRDLDETVYSQNFSSWLFKSYSIRIRHRFTKSSEIFLTHMHLGHDIARAINDRHHELVQAGVLNLSFGSKKDKQIRIGRAQPRSEPGLNKPGPGASGFDMRCLFYG